MDVQTLMPLGAMHGQVGAYETLLAQIDSDDSASRGISATKLGILGDLRGTERLKQLAERDADPRVSGIETVGRRISTSSTVRYGSMAISNAACAGVRGDIARVGDSRRLPTDDAKSPASVRGSGSALARVSVQLSLLSC